MNAPHADLTLADFDFPLPPELIAQHPRADRAASRLLHVGTDRLDDRRFGDLETLLAPGSVLVFNDTRVIKARLLGCKPSGGRVEALVERVLDARPPIDIVAVARQGEGPVLRGAAMPTRSRCSAARRSRR
ncbi:MAG: S-adenosylmethionine:tRNA ribosyltransferase-isomerase [Burkholderiaceae bacterium]|nr:S-adenosylmethionine:tRNA ribosyltransferase-isomerase [Burkholderiaceae bacterium]